MSVPPYHVSAYNTAKASENKIHDDATAQRFGFKGGFVGGVSVYGYMSHQPLQRWGRTWLERGTGEAKFAKPVYDNEIAEVIAVEDADGLALSVQSQGVLCATGRAALPTNLPPAPSLADYKSVAPRPDRPPANQQTPPINDGLGMNPLQISEEFLAQDLQDSRETDPIYASEKIVHPGTILR